MKRISYLLLLTAILSGCGGGSATTTPNDPTTDPTTPPTQATGVAATGVWTTRQEQSPINPVHAIVLKTGNVLFLAGSGNCEPGSQVQCPPTGSVGSATIWNPTAGSFNTFPVPYDVFCNGAVQLADGRVFINGGTATYATGPAAAIMRAMGHGHSVPGGAANKAAENTAGHKVPRNMATTADQGFGGEAQATIFDPSDNSFTPVPNMAAGRWYPTATILGNGDVMVQGGQDQFANDNGLMEQYNAASNSYKQIAPTCNDTGTLQDCRTGQYSDGSFTIPGLPALYPRMFLLPDGRILHAGPEPQVWVYTAGASPNWKPLNNTLSTTYRTYGSNVMLPLSPTNSYAAKIMMFGGMGDTASATNTTEIMDMSDANPMWVAGPQMSQPRTEMNAVLLPNGKVLALGGSANDEDGSTASYNVDLYDPATNKMSLMAVTSFPHLYHSTAVLLPDATVALSGGNPASGVYEPHIEVFQPPYLFNGDGTLATRPALSDVPASVGYGVTISVSASNIKNVVLIRESAPTHAFDMSQREIALTFTSSNGKLTLTMPPNGNVAPPGYYLLFVLDGNGVPSIGQVIQVH